MAGKGVPAVERVRRAVLTGEWGPGAKLQPSDLAERFGTSTTVIREALTRLAGEDLLTTQPNRGFFVRQLSLQELRDITELRCVIEELASRLSLERGTVEWESELVAIHHQLTQTPRRDPNGSVHVTEKWSAVHRAFHMQLLKASGCRPMLRTSESLADATELYGRWAAPSSAAPARDVESEHRQMLEAALARDAPRLAALLRSHYEGMAEMILEAGVLHVNEVD